MMNAIIYGVRLACFCGLWYSFACVAATIVRNYMGEEEGILCSALLK